MDSDSPTVTEEATVAPLEQPGQPAEQTAAAQAEETAGSDDYEELTADDLAEMLDQEIEARLNQRLSMIPPVDRGTFPQASEQPPGEFNWGSLDPLDENFGEALGMGIRSEIQAALQQAFQPLSQTLTELQTQEQLNAYQEQKKDVIADEIARNGDLTEAGRVLLESLTDSYVQDAVERYGPSPRAMEHAVASAAEFIRQLEREAEERALKRHENQLRTLSEATGEPGPAAGASVVPGQPSRYQTPEEIVRKYAI